MKKLILLSALIVIIQSCTHLNFGNFNHQKYTSLKIKSTKFKPTKKIIKRGNKPGVLKKTNTKNETITSNSDQVLIDTNDNNTMDNVFLANVFHNTKLTPKTEKTEFLPSKKQENIKKYKSHSKTKSTNRKNKVNGLLFFLTLLGFPLLFIKRSGYRIATWGSNNVKRAQVLIGVFTVTGLISSFLLGTILEFNISKSMFIIPAVLGLGSVVVDKIKTKNGFFKKKLAVTMLSTSALFLSFSAGIKANFTVIQSISETTTDPVFNVFLTLIILALLIASIFGLAMLSCSLACSGYTILAAILFIGGTTGLILLATLGISKLFQDKNEQKSESIFFNVFLLVVGSLCVSFLLLATFL